MEQTLTEKLMGTIVGGCIGGAVTYFGATIAGQYGLMEKTGGIASSHATDMDSVMDFTFGPGKYFVGAGLAIGLVVDMKRALGRYLDERARLREDGLIDIIDKYKENR